MCGGGPRPRLEQLSVLDPDFFNLSFGFHCVRPVLRLEQDPVSKEFSFKILEASNHHFSFFTVDDMRFALICMKSGRPERYSVPSRDDLTVHCSIFHRVFGITMTRGYKSCTEVAGVHIPENQIIDVTRKLEEMLHYCSLVQSQNRQ